MTEPATSPLMRLRILRHLTQKELAEALGVTENTIANWERGRAIPKLTPNQFKTLVKMLQIGLEDLPDDFGSQSGTPPDQ
ncbi:helix-turn-helix transcriptional regulator [Microseira sp. BLCC-F43]|jgi:transcriptional regulator with XRE-family HTH domain|uniref:helix-turn-helix transcriptional regulator n=1 Tax=Microseira sp. BLCC-F43 TaxID=3153602 RepID=UPI0035BACEC8